MVQRIGWYALGGGLGPLNRALAVLRHLRPRLRDASVMLVTDSRFAHLAIAAGVPTLRVPGPGGIAHWPEGGASSLSTAALRALAPLDLLVVDTYADGRHGELAGEVASLARRKALIVREGAATPEGASAWGAYDVRLAPYAVTPTDEAMPIGTIVNRLPSEAPSRENARIRLGLPSFGERPVLTAMHAGDPGEVMAFFGLVKSASARLDRPHALRLLTPLPLPGDPWPELAHVYPATEVLPAVDLMLSGAGYNTHAELSVFGVRALYRPFDRSQDLPPARLGPTDHVFAALSDPGELAAHIAHALDQPSPRPGDPRDYQGAMAAAEALAALLA